MSFPPGAYWGSVAAKSAYRSEPRVLTYVIDPSVPLPERKIIREIYQQRVNEEVRRYDAEEEWLERMDAADE